MIGILGAFAGTATLHVAVHRDAGTVYDIAADGADGQCSVLGTARVVCPASGPVRFRWGPEGDWVLFGDTEVLPDTTGVAVLLPPEGARSEERALLTGEVTPQQVRQVFLRTSDREIPPPTPSLFADLVGLSKHPDWRVRREVVRALVPYARHSASDPFPADAPSLIPPGLLRTLGTDRDRRVRRRTAALFRELGPEDPRRAEMQQVLERMLVDRNGGVRRVAVSVRSKAAKEGGSLEAVEAWNSALSRVPDPGPPGRAACNGLAKLRKSLDPETVDADGAMALILRHHPERAWRFWGAWREELPFDPVRAEVLLRGTVGLSERLLRHWADESPVELSEVLVRWEPSAPHSERWRVIRKWLYHRVEHPQLAAVLALDDTLSDPSEVPQSE